MSIDEIINSTFEMSLINEKLKIYHWCLKNIFALAFEKPTGAIAYAVR